MKNLNKVKLGSWISVGHMSVVEVMCDSGFDWLCIDLEHTTIDYNEVMQLITIIEFFLISSGVPSAIFRP